ncbi:hypothetical protein P3L10_000724 [Capsicum annuum]
MANNLTKCEFVALQSSGKNYISWVLDVEIPLDIMGLGDTIKKENITSSQNRAKTMIFLHHHLNGVLKIEYLTTKDPLILWNSLKERFDHLKMVILPKARDEWMHLRFQDYKSVHEYNSVMFKISSQLKLCGETVNDDDMMEKTLSTFHASNVNDVHAHHARRGKSRGRGRDDQERNSVPGVNHSSNKKRKDDKREAITYFQCGGKEHYSRDCCALKHLIDIYQASLKKKERNSKANFLSENNVDITSLDIADFFEHPEGKIDHLIGYFSINMEE